MVALAVVVLSGCSAADTEALKNLAMPDRDATTTSHYVFDLWRWGWVAAMATGVVVWGLIFYACFAFRRRSDDEIPIQTRYNLPLEIFYTIAPVIMVVVFFFHTVNAQNALLEEVDDPDHTIAVVGQQWQWTFNYTEEDAVDAPNVFEVGTAQYVPTLYLPVGETVEFQLRSPDVIHNFWITGFLIKMDVVPGRVNSFQVTPMKEGDYVGKCAELCGVSHSRMLFNVKVVSPEEYDAELQRLEEKGNTSDAPLFGGAEAYTQAGLDDAESEEGESE
ncbi:cytochrome c oxidase subunit II [Nocardioides bigeumensis]|uniref:cytochrome-c oxidase n=1 Tax=Nocardioides bigeumensis TaxID=433657 RepID=A0ABN2XWI7_9ACTN